MDNDDIQWNDAINRTISMAKDQLRPCFAAEHNLKLDNCCKIQLQTLINRLEKMTIKEEEEEVVYTVKLTYFKPKGKYYSDGEYKTKKEALFDIWSEVREMRMDGRLPGLIPGHSPFTISVDVLDHPHAHPHLIVY
ncbi:hypothetical protein LCGC14_2295680 [marine sediment metagenome]|uniref:Uncharacterized protein n=1 Tax=marine sediment metagenome TaxID=412755 RepID=A0A0F9FK29_9ZZZZ